MPRGRTGCVVKRKGKIWARISYTDEKGNRRELLRVAVVRADARRILKQLREELDHPTVRMDASVDGNKMTFVDLADAFAAAKSEQETLEHHVRHRGTADTESNRE